MWEVANSCSACLPSFLNGSARCLSLPAQCTLPTPIARRPKAAPPVLAGFECRGREHRGGKELVRT